MTTKEDIEPSEAMNMTFTITTRRMRKCIRHVPSISSFPAIIALNISTDAERTYPKRTFYYLPNHGPPVNVLYSMDMNHISLPYTYHAWTYKWTNWTKYLQSMDYLPEYGSETDLGLNRNEDTVSSFFAALRLEDISNRQAMWEEARMR